MEAYKLWMNVALGKYKTAAGIIRACRNKGIEVTDEAEEFLKQDWEDDVCHTKKSCETFVATAEEVLVMYHGRDYMFLKDELYDAGFSRGYHEYSLPFYVALAGSNLPDGSLLFMNGAGTLKEYGWDVNYHFEITTEGGKTTIDAVWSSKFRYEGHWGNVYKHEREYAPLSPDQLVVFTRW